MLQRWFFLHLSAFAALGSASLATASAASDPLATAYTIPSKVVTSSYFIKAHVPPGRWAEYVVHDPTTFDALFGFAAVMGKPQPTVVPSAFANSTILAVAFGGQCDLTPVNVDYYADRKLAIVNYNKLGCRPGGTATFVTPLLLQVARDVEKVQFIENGFALGAVTTAQSKAAARHVPPAPM